MEASNCLKSKYVFAIPNKIVGMNSSGARNPTVRECSLPSVSSMISVGVHLRVKSVANGSESAGTLSGIIASVTNFDTLVSDRNRIHLLTANSAGVEEIEEYELVL